MSGVHVIWFKRDLRIHDHAALAAALASGGPVLPLYIFEPGLWTQPESSRRQFDFLMESLTELDEALTGRGARLVVRTGTALDVFADLHRRHGLAAIHTHEETGLQWSFERDKAVRRWALQAGVSLREQDQSGIFRGLKDRDGWAARWDEAMSRPRLRAPEAIPMAAVPSGPWPIAEDFGLREDECPGRQKGGRTAGVELLRSFLAGRGRRYRKAMSSPAGAAEACSRLSPHLAFGTVSVREAVQAARRAKAAYEVDGDTTYADSLDSFLARLQWRSHLMQKLEDDTSIGVRPLPPAYDGLRPEAAAGDARLDAWLNGRTGFPFVDACMRSLRSTGWLNFRMRAMLIGFATHHLWMDWKRPAEQLATLFTDFEPGIHYPQAQMQSAITGTNIPRVYNPVKQSQEQDPDGAFIRRWVPELAALPTQYLHAPWEAPKAELARAGIVFGQTYPMRMVDHIAAAREARERIAATRRKPGHAETARVLEDRHGSHKAGIARPTRRAGRLGKVHAGPVQLSFDLGLPPPAR
ncbi:MAG: FAD-binding domain-containing protein [Hyphomonas sp.]|uniref:FAD-binding domain-containing protein n=1 Tax=Hyphomonas sp. TaxID=87 RepID=UPI003528BF31